MPSFLLSRADRIIQVVEAVGLDLERIVQRYQRINKRSTAKVAQVEQGRK